MQGWCSWKYSPRMCREMSSALSSDLRRQPLMSVKLSWYLPENNVVVMIDCWSLVIFRINSFPIISTLEVLMPALASYGNGNDANIYVGWGCCLGGEWVVAVDWSVLGLIKSRHLIFSHEPPLLFYSTHNHLCVFIECIRFPKTSHCMNIYFRRL